MMATKARHPSTFSPNHRSCVAFVPTNPPRYLLPITICRPYPRKKASNRGMFRGDTTKTLLVVFKK